MEWQNEGVYQGTPMSDLLILIAKLSKPGTGTPELIQMRESGGLKRFDIHVDLVSFADGQLTFDDLIANRLICNIDVQVHTQKGVIGVMIQGGQDIKLTDVAIGSVQNLGERTFVEICAAHDPIGKGGYDGTDARGLAVVASRGVTLNNVTIGLVHSETGESIGVDVH